MADLGARIQAAGAHPARTVVLLPYFQLLPLARRAWAQLHPDGFAPRFETTMSWARALPFAPGPADLSLDMARDLPAARHWLERAGMAARAQALVPSKNRGQRITSPLRPRGGGRARWVGHFAL